MLQTDQETSEGHPSDTEVVRSFLGALERLDFDAVLDLSAPKIVWINAPLKTAGSKRQFERALKLMFRRVTRFEAECSQIEQRADGVVFTARIDTVEGRGLFMRIAVQSEFVVKDGLVASWVDRFSWKTALGDIAKSLPRMVRNGLKF